MPDATITSTASTFGSISGTFSADQSTVDGTVYAITGTVNGSVGVPGPQGPQGEPGPPGQGVAAGGSTGQVLQKLSGVSYDTGWLTLPADYITSVTAPLAVTAGDLSIDLSSYLLSSTAASTYYLQTNPNGFITASALTPYLPLAGGAMTGSITSSSATYDTEMAGDLFGVQLSSDHSKGSVLQFNGLDTYDGASHMLVTPTGLTFPDASVQTTAYTGGGGYITSVTAPLAVTTGDLSIDLSSYLLSSTAASTYYLQTNPDGFITSAALTGYATESFVTSQGYLTTIFDVYGRITFGNGTNPDPTPMPGRFWFQSDKFRYSTSSSSLGNVIATESFVTTSFAPLASPTFTGNPTAPTPATSDNDTSIATTAYVKAQAFGDRYLSSSTTSNTIGNGNKTFTIGTGLSYTPTQNITISYDASNHMHGEVLTYSTSTGVLTVDVKNHAGSGTYASWVVNVGGVTPATSVAFADITGAVSGNTNLQAALDLKANLASPTFSGTPSLPTGTIGVTQTAGNSTTALATTAFVTAAVPAIATAAQAITGTSATVALSPSTLGAHLTRGFTQRFDFITTTSTSGSGQVTTAFGGWREIYVTSSASAGRASFSLGSVGSLGCLSGYSDESKIDYSKKIWVAGRASINFSATYVGDANTSVSCAIGGFNTNTTGNMNVAGIGWRKAGGSGAFVTLMVHNGTTFTTVATTKTVATLEVFDWLIYSDGTGNVTLYINGVSSATTSAGPTGLGGANQNVYREQCEKTAVATQMLMHSYGGCYYSER